MSMLSAEELAAERFDMLAHLVEVAGLSDSCEGFDVDREQAEVELIAALNQGAKAQAEIDRMRIQLTEKKGELAVAYGGGHSEAEQEWFSALDRANAERDELRALAVELVKTISWWTEGRPNYVNEIILGTQPGDAKGCAEHIQREATVMLAKARDAGLLGEQA